MGRKEREELRAALADHGRTKPGDKGHTAAHQRAMKAQDNASMAELVSEAFLANFRK